MKNTSTVVKQFVVDYTVETLDPLMEHEVNGLDYRYVYGFQNLRLSVNISPIDGGAGSIVETGTVGEQIRLYYHQDLRGTVDYLTSPVSQKVESWTHYNEWGEITHNAVVKCGYREFDLVKNYTGHEYDAVLNLYYAKARMYDAENRRFTSVDPILDASRYDVSEYVTNPMQLVQYIYVVNNPLIFIDPLGLMTAHLMVNNTNIPDNKWYFTSDGKIRIDLNELGRTSAYSWGFKPAGQEFELAKGRYLNRPYRGFLDYSSIQFEFVADDAGFNSYAYTATKGFHSVQITFVKHGDTQYYIDLEEFSKLAPAGLVSYRLYYTFDTHQELYDYIYNEILPPYLDIAKKYFKNFNCENWTAVIGLGAFGEGSPIYGAGARVAGSIGLGLDAKGNIKWVVGVSGGGSVGTSLGANAFVSVIQDVNLENLIGLSFEIGSSVSAFNVSKALAGEALQLGISPGLGVDLSWSNGIIPNGYIYSFGASMGFPVEAHAQLTLSGTMDIDLATLNFLQGSKPFDLIRRIVKP